MSKDENDEPMGGIVDDQEALPGDPELFGLLAWNNVVDTGTVSVLGDGYSLTPITNVQDRRLAKSWRYQTNGEEFTLSCALGNPRVVRLVAVNIIAPLVSAIDNNGPMTVSLYDAANNSIASFIAQPLPIQGEGQFFPKWVFFDFGELQAGVSRVEVTFHGKWRFAPDGIVEIGRFWASYGLSLPGGFDAGWSQEVTAPQAKMKRSRSGQAYVRAAVPQRTTSFAASNIDEADVLLSDDVDWRPTVQQLAMQTAAFEECIALVRTNSSSLMQALGVYGSLVEGVTWRHETATFYSVNFKHLEER